MKQPNVIAAALLQRVISREAPGLQAGRLADSRESVIVIPLLFLYYACSLRKESDDTSVSASIVDFNK